MHPVSKIPGIMTSIITVFLLAQPSHQGIATIQITIRFNNIFTKTQRMDRRLLLSCPTVCNCFAQERM